MGNCGCTPRPPPQPPLRPSPPPSPPRTRPPTTTTPPPPPTTTTTRPPQEAPSPSDEGGRPVKDKEEGEEEHRRQEQGLDGEQSKRVEEVPKESVELKRLLLKYEGLIREADQPVKGNLQDHVFSGIFINQKRKKCWVDEKSRCVCFMVFARELSITRGNDPRYWQWFTLQETSDAGVEVARLLDVEWLEIQGRFETSYLTEGVTYEVAFVVMVKDPSHGWDVPVSLRLVSPGGGVQRRMERLADKPKGQWVELVAGEFAAPADGAGEVEFSLLEYEDGGWKRGLVVKGVSIRPKA